MRRRVVLPPSGDRITSWRTANFCPNPAKLPRLRQVAAGRPVPGCGGPLRIRDEMLVPVAGVGPLVPVLAGLTFPSPASPPRATGSVDAWLPCRSCPRAVRRPWALLDRFLVGLSPQAVFPLTTGCGSGRLDLGTPCGPAPRTGGAP
jgi:hypothetical protein